MSASRFRRRAIAAIAATFALMVSACGADQATGGSDSAARTLRLDYAYYNVPSLVLKDKGWLEAELADRNVTVEWVLSAGSNKANENLNAGAIDISSTAGAAALVARANGVAHKTVGVFSQPEWAAIVVPKDSPLTSVSDLVGKKVAATKGTDPYFFLLQTLREAGLSGSDVEVVNLQHADGRAALERGDVDAWAGLDPITATSELQAGSRLLYRNIDFNSYGVLNASEKFIANNADLLEIVLNAYAKARAYVQENPDEASQILASQASIDVAVAAKVVKERTNFDTPLVPGEALLAVFDAIIPTLVAEGQVRSQAEVDAARDSLLDASYAQKVSLP
jgi:sulfonate transport system substrate-binding protein